MLLHQLCAATSLSPSSSPSSLARVAACVLLASAAAADEPPMPTEEYFNEYGLLYDHVGMLQDNVRMGAYFDAIKLNAARHFKDKVVLDVGAGTGVLSIWAAQAGARKVYAIEATGVAAHAEKMVKAHNLENVVTVLNGKMEEVELPEKVDVVLSEWMGYFLLRESMVQSVIYARDKWLKPGGAMYPSHARLLIAPMAEPGFLEMREQGVGESMDGWAELSREVNSRYGLKLEALREAYEEENVEYHYRHAWQGGVGSGAVIGTPSVLLDVDMHTVTMGDFFGWQRTVTLPSAAEVASDGSGVAAALLADDKPISMLCGWFDVRFCADGGGGTAADAWADSADAACVELTTSPTAPYTHWAHTTVVLDPPLTASRTLDVGLQQSKRSHHDLNLTLTYPVVADDGTVAPGSASYFITAEFRTSERVADGHEGADGYDEEDDPMLDTGMWEQEDDSTSE